jgi:hypothetical protein
MHIASTRSLPRLANRPGHPQFADDPGGAQSSVPGIPADREDAVPPNGPCGRGAVLCARCSCGRRGRRPSRPVGARKGTGRLGTLGVRHGHRGLPFLADREDAVPPMRPCGRGTIPCARIFLRTMGRGPSLTCAVPPTLDGRRPRPPHGVHIRAWLLSTRAPGASPHAARLHASRAPLHLPPCTLWPLRYIAKLIRPKHPVGWILASSLRPAMPPVALEAQGVNSSNDAYTPHINYPGDFSTDPGCNSNSSNALHRTHEDRYPPS